MGPSGPGTAATGRTACSFFRRACTWATPSGRPAKPSRGYGTGSTGPGSWCMSGGHRAPSPGSSARSAPAGRRGSSPIRRSQRTSGTGPAAISPAWSGVASSTLPGRRGPGRPAPRPSTKASLTPRGGFCECASEGPSKPPRLPHPVLEQGLDAAANPDRAPVPQARPHHAACLRLAGPPHLPVPLPVLGPHGAAPLGPTPPAVST